MGFFRSRDSATFEIKSWGQIQPRYISVDGRLAKTVDPVIRRKKADMTMPGFMMAIMASNRIPLITPSVKARSLILPHRLYHGGPQTPTKPEISCSLLGERLF